MRASARTEFIAIHRNAEKDLNALFAQVTEQIAGLIAAASNEDGTIPLQNQAALQAEIVFRVGQVFTVFRSLNPAERSTELARLLALVEETRKQLRAATKAQTTYLSRRLDQLIRQYEMVATTDRIRAAYDTNGNPVSPYARILMGAAGAVILAGLLTQKKAIRARFDESTYQALASVITGDNIVTLAENSLLGYRDSRGFDGADRVWALGEEIKFFVERQLSGLFRATNIAKRIIEGISSLLNGKAKNNAVYGAKRMIRGELTRMFGTTMREGARSLPVKLRVKWRVSAWHDPALCDGSCDKWLALSNSQDGFDPDEAPIPVKDTHGNCRCDIYYDLGNRQIVIDSGSLRLRLTPASPSMHTWLLKGRAQVL